MTSKLTREERIQSLYGLKIGQVLNQSDIENIKMLARMALAAMDSEPVAWTETCEITNMQATGLYLRGFPDNSHGRNIPLYRHAQQPVVQCPYPCGWDTLNKLAIQDAAFVARGLVEGEPVTESLRQAAISSNDCLLKVIAACRAAMLQAGTLTNEDTKKAWTGIPDIDNAIIMLDRIDTLESCDDDRIEAVKAVLRGLAGNSPVIPEGYVMVPAKLTAENGAKSALLGEFNLEYTLTCHECFGEGCEDCNDEGRWINSIPVDWTTIKAIWAKAVEHFVATMQEEKSE